MINFFIDLFIASISFMIVVTGIGLIFVVIIIVFAKVFDFIYNKEKVNE